MVPSRARHKRRSMDVSEGFLVETYIFRLRDHLKGNVGLDVGHAGVLVVSEVENVERTHYPPKRSVGEAQQPQVDVGPTAHLGQVFDLSAAVFGGSPAIHQ